ncbi:acyltransferase family protein [Virgibacillus dakarensis]|nr:acyltransferase family protein [Virgibacillus dakarensis]
MQNKDIKLSNLKGILIFLVVFGHVIEHYNHQFNELYVFIYAFHMPLFVFISGYLAKRVKVSKIINLVLLYLIFQTFFNWYLYFLGEYETFPLHYGRPQFHLWYIVSLGIWYAVALCILKFNIGKLGKWVTFILIFLICLISRWYVEDVISFINNYYGNFTTYTLSYQRSLSFAPFFFAGFFIKKRHLEKLYNLINCKSAKVTIALAFSMLIFLLIQRYPEVEDVFRGSYGAQRFLNPNDGFLFYLFVISSIYFISSFICLMILNFVTDRISLLSKWGDHSLTIFLFHPVFVFYLWQFDFFGQWNSDTQFLFFFILTVGISYTLGSNLFVKSTKYICNPYKFFKRLFCLRIGIR